MRLFLMLGSINAFLFVALGAFGAHALKPRLEAGGFVGTWETAVQYQMIHALALVAVAILTQHLDATRFVYGAGWSFFVGIIIFSGSLYVLSMTRISAFGAITPIGGFAFLIGWTLLFVAALKQFS